MENRERLETDMGEVVHVIQVVGWEKPHCDEDIWTDTWQKWEPRSHGHLGEEGSGWREPQRTEEGVCAICSENRKEANTSKKGSMVGDEDRRKQGPWSGRDL